MTYIRFNIKVNDTDEISFRVLDKAKEYMTVDLGLNDDTVESIVNFGLIKRSFTTTSVNGDTITFRRAYYYDDDATKENKIIL